MPMEDEMRQYCVNLQSLLENVTENYVCSDISQKEDMKELVGYDDFLI